jgi:hypothetical protein
MSFGRPKEQNLKRNQVMSEEVSQQPEVPQEKPLTPQEKKVAELATLLTRIQATRNIVNLDLAGWDPASRPGMEVAKNNAKDTLDNLVQKYRNEVYQSAAILFVTTNGSSESFTALEDAAVKMGAIVVDASKPYRSIAQNIESKLGSDRRLLVDFVLDIERMASDLCGMFGVNGSFLRVPASDYDKTLPTFEDVVSLVRDVFRKSAPDYIQALGETIAVLAARQDFYTTCETSGIAEVPTAVMVTRLTPEEVAGFQTHFLPGRPFHTFEADKVKNPEKALEKAASELLKKLGL